VIVGVLVGSAVASTTSGRSLLLFVGAFQLVAAALMIADVSKLPLVQLIARQGAALNVFSMACGGDRRAGGHRRKHAVHALFQGDRDGGEAGGRYGRPRSVCRSAWPERSAMRGPDAMCTSATGRLGSSTSGDGRPGCRRVSDRSGGRGARAQAIGAHAVDLLRPLPVRQRRHLLLRAAA